MASANQAAKAEAKKAIEKVAKEVIKETKNSAQRNQGPGKRWYNKKGRHMPKNREKRTKQTVDKEVNKKLRKEGLEGPRSRFSVRVSATVGKLGPNHAQGPELQVASFLHPALMKEPNDGTNFGPLQAAAAQWGLWRISSLSVRFTPLVGASAVTGSVYRASLNLTQSPGNANWGGLGARNHIDIPVGRSTTWKLKRGDFNGPRQTWWMTDTNEEGGQSAGPMLEVHGLGKTTSTYQDRDWTGDLFIVEVDGRWEFTNYNSKPALGTLDRKTEDLQGSKAPSMAVGDDGVLTMSIPSDTRLARFMSDASERNAPPEGSVGETIWQVVDEGVGLASSVTPVPFNWLIRSGWWFIKKIAGRSSNAVTTYQVFASLADAQNNKPVIAERMASTTAATILTVTQINAPNVGPADTRTNFHSGISPFPLKPAEVPPPPGSVVRLMATARSLFEMDFTGLDTSLRVVLKKAVHSYPFRVYGPNSYFTHISGALKLTSMSALAISPEGEELGFYNPGYFRATGYLAKWRDSSSVLGQVLAWSHEDWGASSSAPFTLAAYLVRVTTASSATDLTSYLPYAPTVYVGGGSSVTPPLQLTGNKVDVIAVTKPGSTTHQTCLVRLPPFSVGDMLLLYNIGKGTNEILPQGDPLPGSSNDVVITNTRTFTSGLWGTLLSTITPVEDYMSFQMTLPNAETEEDKLVSKILGLIKTAQSTPDSESEEGSEVSEEESDDEEPCTEGPTPPQPTPRLKLAKEMMYEALRDSDWTHVDAEALLAAISSKN